MKKSQNKHKDHRTVLLEWETPEFAPTPRGKIWYYVAGLVMTALVVYALVTGSITMAIVFVMMAVIFLMMEKKEPKIVNVIITDMGISYNGTFYPYHHINAFWVVYHPLYVRVLYLRLSSGRRYKLVRIELDHQKPQEVRKLLLREIPEIEGAQEPATDLIARILRLQ